jgi:lincosamide nucleotidyltransferase A/C/D/E
MAAPEMDLDTVLDVWSTCEALGIGLWLDGGWGVDALLGGQTRPHEDLDVAIEERDLPRLRALLEARGYREVPKTDSSPWNFVLGDDRGREVDLHVVVLDEAGNGRLGPPENGLSYPAAALTGNGTLRGTPVRCISPEWAVRFHSGYALAPKDFADVSALCARFRLALPADYARFLAPPSAPAAPGGVTGA